MWSSRFGVPKPAINQHWSGEGEWLEKMGEGLCVYPQEVGNLAIKGTDTLPLPGGDGA